MPGEKELADFAIEYNVEVVYVSSHAHRKNAPEKGQWVYVDSSKELADLYIMNHICREDILVTQDIGLASLALSKKVYTISPRGKIYKEETIITALDFRYVAAKERRKGKHGKEPKPYTGEDRDMFIRNFREILSKVAGNS